MITTRQTPHVSGRLSLRRGPRRDKPPASRTTVLGLLVVTALAGGCYLMLSVYNGIPLRDYRRVSVSLPSVGNLIPHDAVRIGGTRVGQVLHLGIGSDGRPRVDLQLDPGTRLPVDTKVGVRANGLLGARYVELRPGTSRSLLADGATLRAGTDAYTYGLPETVAVFDRGARGGLRKTIGGLGAGLYGNGAALNTSLKDLGHAPGDFTRVARAVLARQGAAARLIPSLESAFGQLDRVRGYARPFLVNGSKALWPFVAERAATRASLAAAPAALRAATAGLRRGQPLLVAVDQLSNAAARTLASAPSGLRGLAGLLGDAQPALRRAFPTVAELLSPALDHARTALVATEPVVGHIRSGIDTGRPLLGSIGAHACDVENAGVVLRSMTGFGQPGHGPHGAAMAFRLQSVMPAGAEAIGVKDTTGLLKREADERPCKYHSQPYPQNLPPLTRAPALKRGVR